jgi:hypothetical protein
MGSNAPVTAAETGASASMSSSLSGYAAMDPTLSLVAGCGLPVIPYAPTEGTLLQLRLQALQQQELQRQQQWRTQLLLSVAADQDQIRLDVNNGSASWPPPLLDVSLSNSGSAVWSTPQLLDVSLPNNYANSATIGRRALAMAMVRAASNVQFPGESASDKHTRR